MDSKEFVRNCLVTESNDFKAIRERLKDEHLLNALYCILSDFTYFAQELDKLKKYIFYGKPLPNQDDKPYLEFYDFNKKQLAATPEDKTIRLLHGILGLATETAELTKPLSEHLFEGAEVDKVNIIEEVADGGWYQSIILDTLGEDSFEPSWERVIAKLKARYGDKFSETAAINRNLDVERSILEG